MGLADDLRAEVKKTFTTGWTKRTGQVVPNPEDLKLGNDAVELLPATVLYADLDGSTDMVNQRSWEASAEVYKTFLHCATKLIRARGGSITSFDGDRVMGIFLGDSKNTSAVKCAMQIKYAVREIVTSEHNAFYKNNPTTIKHVVGVDVSNIRAARTGIRNSNDIVWVGRAANYAAKLIALSGDAYSTWITEDVYKNMNDEVKYVGNPRVNMWDKRSWTSQGGRTLYASHYHWSF